MGINDEIFRTAVEVIIYLERIKRVGGIDDPELMEEIADLVSYCDAFLAEWDREDATKNDVPCGTFEAK